MRATSTAAALPHAATGPRVLVLRSCRPAEFAAAVRGVRERRPTATVVALSHRGHGDSLRAAGVDEIVEVGGRRFGLLRINPAALLRLRRARFDEVVVPQMTPYSAQYMNLHRIAAAIGATSVTIVPGGEPAITTDARAFVRQLLFGPRRRDWAALYQGPVFLLALLVAACVWRRKNRAGAHVQRAPGKRRVLHIISSLGVGGAQRQLAELINRTPADRYDIDLLVLGRSDGDFSRRWIARPVRIAYLRSDSRLFDAVMDVRRHCSAGRYDLVHTWLFMANVVGAAGARLAGVPYVIASVRNLSLWKRTWYAQWWFRPADVLCARAADLVTVNAEGLKEDHGAWAWYPRRRIALVHNGLDPSHFLGEAREARRRVREVSGLSPDARVIGTVGRLAPEKDHRTFLRIVEHVHRIAPDVHAVVVGDGQMRGELEALARSMGLADVVTFLGERVDARQLTAGLDVFVLPSAIEGFPNVLLEAAFLGVPAVASRVGGSPDVLSDAGDTFEVGDAAAAAQRILQLLDDPASALGRAEETRTRAFTMFTADRAASRWFALYDRCRSEEAHL